MYEMAYNYEVFIGTYEHFLLSYKIVKPKTEDYLLEPFIAQRVHTASTRCMDTNGRYLATGGSDDRISVLDLKLNQEIQTLDSHTGNINCLKFTPDLAYLLSVSDDGSMIATKTGSWIAEKKWTKAHTNKPITDLSIHPTGRLALTLGRDSTVRTWNLISGKQVFTTNMEKITPKGSTVNSINWAPDGVHFALTHSAGVSIMSSNTAAVVQEIRLKFKIQNICWLTNSAILIGLDNGKIKLANIDSEGTDTETYFTVCEGSRVKSMDYVETSENTGILATVVSSGELTVWHVSVGKKKIKRLCSINIGCRPTCLKLVDAVNYRKNLTVKNESESIIDNPKITTSTVTKTTNVGSVLVETDDDEDEDDYDDNFDGGDDDNDDGNGDDNDGENDDDDNRIIDTPKMKSHKAKTSKRPNDLISDEPDVKPKRGRKRKQAKQINE